MRDGRTARAATVDPAILYERTRLEFVSLLLVLSEDELRVQVPATPAWSVRDVLAHVVGLVSDLNAQRFPLVDDGGGADWTQAQVDRTRGLTLRDLIAEWGNEAPKFEAGLRAFGYEFGSHFLADLVVHYQDVRSALGLDPSADELTVAVSLDHYAGFISELLTANGWGKLEVVAGHETRILGGNGRLHAHLQTEPLELLRVMSGRRSVRQMRALDWQGDADDLLLLMPMVLAGAYSVPRSDLVA